MSVKKLICFTLLTLTSCPILCSSPSFFLKYSAAVEADVTMVSVPLGFTPSVKAAPTFSPVKLGLIRVLCCVGVAGNAASPRPGALL